MNILSQRTLDVFMSDTDHPRECLIVGSSHTRALKTAKNAIDRSELVFSELSIHWLINEKRSGTSPALGDTHFSDIVPRIRSLRTTDILCMSILGTFHNIFGLLRHTVPFNIFDSADHPDTYSDLPTLIPKRAVEDMFREHIEANTSIRRTKNETVASCFHLATPPPKQDNQYISDRARNYRGQSVEDFGINSPELRLKLYNIEMSVLAEVCREWGIGFIPAPSEALTADGFLKPEFYANDATHANPAYGALVLRQLADLPAGIAGAEGQST